MPDAGHGTLELASARLLMAPRQPIIRTRHSVVTLPTFQRVVRVVYPVTAGNLVLRSEANWAVDIEPFDGIDGKARSPSY